MWKPAPPCVSISISRWVTSLVVGGGVVDDPAGVVPHEANALLVGEVRVTAWWPKADEATGAVVADVVGHL